MPEGELRALVQQVTELLGREVRVYRRQAAVVEGPEGPTTPSTSAPFEGDRPGEGDLGDEDDSIYEFTAADYARVMASKKQDLYLKPRAIQEREKAARQSRIPHAVVCVRFPDDWVLEATFAASETVTAVRHLVEKALEETSTPFHFCVTPPKERIKDESQSLYDAGLAPGALIYFEPEIAPAPAVAGVNEGGGGGAMKPGYKLREVVLRIKGAHLTLSAEPPPQAKQDAQKEVEVQKPKELRGKPKWFK